MQKKLIALAVAGLASTAAFADSSNVTMYGVVDAALINASASGEHSQTQMVSGGLATSRIGVKGVEDLGNGLKVVANLEYALNTQDAGGIGAARQEMLALAGSFGTVATGYLQTTGYDFGVKYDVAAGSTVSPLQDITNSGRGFLVGAVAGASRAPQAVAYISPNMSGLTVAYNHAWLATNLGASSLAADAQVTADLLSGNYDNGPLSVGLVYARTSTPVSAADQKEWALGGSYDFGVATVKATYQTTHNGAAGQAGNNNKVWSLGGVIPAGPGAVLLSYAQSNIGTANNADSKGYTLGYLYPMSKRTTAYAAYSHTSNDAAAVVSVVNSGLSANMTGNGSSSLLALGLKHTF